MKLFDSHCHLNFRAYQRDREEVIKRTIDSGTKVITVGTNLRTSREAVEIASTHDGVYASIGLHPIHLSKDIEETDSFDGEEYSFTTKSEVFDKAAFFELSKNKKVVAVGECGLDYFHAKDYCDDGITEEQYKDLQKETFYEILGFAREIDKPIIIHCRDAYDDLIEILSSYGDNSDGASAEIGVKGVVHCFSGNLQQAQQILNLGLYIGITCIVTFPNAKELQSIVAGLPLDRLLIETDAPYLAPQEHRGERNEPAYVRFAAKKIAELKNMPFDEVATQTHENAKKLFNIT